MKLAIMLPGTAYTKGFFQSWTALISHLDLAGITYTIANHYCPVVYEGRNLMLLNGAEANIDAVPLNGEDYDYMLWLETDMVFKAEDVMKLIEADKDVISGVYPMGTTSPDAAVAGWYPNKRVYIPELKKHAGEIVNVDFCGLGFLLVKKGIFEDMQYPWFWEMYSEPDENGVITYLGDDFSFCNHVRELGYVVNLHCGVIVGHEKTIVL